MEAFKHIQEAQSNQNMQTDIHRDVVIKIAIIKERDRLLKHKKKKNFKYKGYSIRITTDILYVKLNQWQELLTDCL